MDFEDCIPHFEVLARKGGRVWIAYGVRMPRLFAVDEDVYELLREFLDCGEIDRSKAQEVIGQESESAFHGINMQEFLDEVLSTREFLDDALGWGK